MNKTVIIFIYILLLFSCKKEISVKKDDNTEIKDEKIINENKKNIPVQKIQLGFKKLLILNQYPIDIKKSESGRFLYIYIKSNPDDTSIYERSLPIKESFQIDNFKFEKGEMNWWIIYDKNIDKILYKNNLDNFIGAGKFTKNEKYFYQNLGTYVTRNILFFDLVNPNKDVIKIGSIAGFDSPYRDFDFSQDDKFLIYQYSMDLNKFDFNCNNVGIKILNLKTNKETKIIPKDERAGIRIIKIDGDKIIYEELKERKEYVLR